MRNVRLSHRVSERLLELATLDVYAGRRTSADARSLMDAFDAVYRRLQDDTQSLATYGTPTRRFFGLVARQTLRRIGVPAADGLLVLGVRFDETINECEIESVELV